MKLKKLANDMLISILVFLWPVLKLMLNIVSYLIDTARLNNKGGKDDSY